MNVTELIGFVASLLAMLFFMGKQIYENRSHSKNHKNKSNDSNRTRSEREERLRKFLGSLSDDMKEATSLPSSDRRRNSVEEEEDEDEDYEEEGYDDEDEEESRQTERDKQLMIAKELHRSELNAFQSKHQKSIPVTSEDNSSRRRLLSDDFTYHANMDKFSQQTNIESRKLNTSIENRYYGEMHGDNLVSEELRVAQSDQSAQHAYDIVTRHEISRAKRILRNLSSPRDMVICAEILGKPKAFE